jgi:serine protease Do
VKLDVSVDDAGRLLERQEAETQMTTRTRTIASFFTLAMAAMLVGAFVTAEVGRPEPARAAEGAPKVTATRAAAVTLDDFRDIARQATSAVVNVNTRKVMRTGGSRERNPFREFFGDDFMDRFGVPRSQTQTSLGSGFVIDKDGYILTNRHVVDEADEIQVTLADARTTYPAKLVGKDARTDVALLKIEPKAPLTVLPLGDSDRTEVAEWVMAIGSPFGLGNTVTVGVVSYKGRPITLGTQGTSVDLIQTDASINPGNSGGPLINTKGEVIGINTLIITQGAPQSAGVGFAVPINVAKGILAQLREHGKVVRGWLGIQISNLSEDMAKSFGLADTKGALIQDLDERGPATKAGLLAGDIVLEVDGRRIEDNGDLSSYIANRAPGTTVTLKVFRDGREQTVKVTLATFPDEAGQLSTDEERGASLGMTLRELTPDIARQLDLPRETRGVVVTGVEAGESAERAGLQRGDVILSVNGARIENVDAFEQEIDKARPDGLARLRVRRGSGHTFVILRFK